MASDPKQRFKQYVGKESGGGRPKGQGYITELQRQKLQPAHLDVIVTNNKARKHYPRRIPDADWLDVKAELKRRESGWPVSPSFPINSATAAQSTPASCADLSRVPLAATQHWNSGRPLVIS